MRILVTRPEPDASALAGILKALGHEVVVEPLLSVGDLPAPDLSFDKVQALVFTSANGVRAFARHYGTRDLPVHGVGAATVAAARDAGFGEIHQSDGDVVSLATDLGKTCDPARGSLLHIAGSVVAKDLAMLLEPQGFEVRREVLYEAVPLTQFSTELATALSASDPKARIDAVALYSPRTARVFRGLMNKDPFRKAARRLTAICLSGNVAAELEGLQLAEIRVAAHPTQKHLLKCLDETSR